MTRQLSPLLIGKRIRLVRALANQSLRPGDEGLIEGVDDNVLQVKWDVPGTVSNLDWGLGDRWVIISQ